MTDQTIGHLSAADHEKVSKAVAAAEAQTSGEIVTIVTDLSDSYHDVALVWSSAVAMLALSLIAALPDVHLWMVDRATGGWSQAATTTDYLWLLSGFVLLVWIGTYLALRWMPLRLMLTPRAVKQRRVRSKAIDLFRVGTDAKTAGRTGILLYLSLDEHRADIVADRAIAEKVTPDVWGAAMASLIADVASGRPGDGLAAAVMQMGIVLAQHFPKGQENPNELPDRLIEL